VPSGEAKPSVAEKMAALSGAQSPEKRLADIAASIARQKDAIAEPAKSEPKANAEVAREPEVARPAAAAPVSGSTGSEHEVDAFRKALVSPSVEAAVTGSIDRLKKSVADNHAAQVEAVLRPMLREWLDNNLPKLVETVVREEISRLVASSSAAEAAE